VDGIVRRQCGRIQIVDWPRRSLVTNALGLQSVAIPLSSVRTREFRTKESGRSGPVDSHVKNPDFSISGFQRFSFCLPSPVPCLLSPVSCPRSPVLRPSRFALAPCRAPEKQRSRPGSLLLAEVRSFARRPRLLQHPTHAAQAHQAQPEQHGRQAAVGDSVVLEVIHQPRVVDAIADNNFVNCSQTCSIKIGPRRT